MPIKKIKREAGTILITTLLLLAVVTVIAVGMAERGEIDIKRTSQLLTAQQAYFYVKPAEIWAAQLLQSLPLTITKETALLQWPQIMPALSITGGVVNATLYDAQGEFYNLNNLSDPNAQSGFSMLLKTFLPVEEMKNEKFLLAAMVSWIAPSGQETDTLSDQYYLGLNPPYRAAHHLFVSPSELRLVKGITAKSYSLLMPHLIALPERTPVNINTANQAVFTSSGFSANDANFLIAIRQGKGGFKNLTDFTGLPMMQNRNLSGQNFTIDSTYFLLKTTVRLNQQYLTVYTLFKRTKNTSKKSNDIKILWQTRGTL